MNKSNHSTSGGSTQYRLMKTQVDKPTPNIPREFPEIPPIDAFKLDNILAGELKQESQEVVDAVLKVATCYQNDLKSEIRHKLSIEQKIQFKNIEVAKLSQALNKNISHRNKRLNKAINGNGAGGGTSNTTSLLLLNTDSTIDDDVTQLLELSINSSETIHELTRKLSKIDQKISRRSDVLGLLGSAKKKDYPYLSKILSDRGKKTTNDISSFVREHVLATSPENDKTETKFKNDKKPKPNVSIENKKDDIPNKKSAFPIKDEEEMNEEQFEMFMSSSINKYRDNQLNKYGYLDIFTDSQQNFLHSDLNENKIPQDNTFKSISNGRSLGISVFKPGNPLRLLHSSLVEFPNLSDNKSSSASIPMNYMAPNIKSAATVKPTIQTSHFKKLRINGSPITSQTMKDLPTCECNEQEVTKRNYSTENCDDSPAKKALSNSLEAFEHHYASSEDTSGLNTEEDEDDIEHGHTLSSDSSDCDSLSSSTDKKEPSTTDQYYLSLKTGLKNKRRLQRGRIRNSPKHSIYRREDLSPTPKHIPSHHSLKPKQSILKLSSKVQNNSRMNPVRRTNTILSPVRKKNYTKVGINRRREGSSGINDLTVSGTMVPAVLDSESSDYEYEGNEVISWNGRDQQPTEDISDTVSLRSISNLKGYL